MDSKVALDTLKSFKEIMSPEDFKEFLKGEDSAKLRAVEEKEVQEFLKAEMGEEAEEGKKKDDESEEGKKKDDDESKEEEKAISAEFMKGFGEELEAKIEAKFESKLKGVTDLLKSLIPSLGEQTEIKKSVDSIKETLDKISDTPQGRKAVRTGNANFFEKAFGGEEIKDESGKEVLSVSLNKEKVLKALEKGLSETKDEELTKAYESSIIRYNGGSGRIDQEAAVDLFEKHNIRLVQ